MKGRYRATNVTSCSKTSIARTNVVLLQCTSCACLGWRDKVKMRSSRPTQDGWMGRTYLL
uniref:Uncharacterized protein n=1 Tax=Picea glauca TaxID=3330 RepID=A0A101LUS7_PICGL|nr:hypothetical protein ABT39_MTgene2640 [Picea glauca]